MSVKISCSPFKPGDKVYKEECMYCFHNPESQGGLYVCLHTFYGFCSRHLMVHHAKTGNSSFLHYVRLRFRKELPKSEENLAQQPTKLAIGVEGGFDAQQKMFEFEHIWSLSPYPSLKEIPLTDPGVPDQVRLTCDAVIAADSAFRLQELEALAGSWDGSFRVATKHQNLQQIDNGVKVPTSGWKCQAEGCTKTENLWLNLTDGSILCGRRNFDGSGGNNHAVEYYGQTHFPLAVKLGTITPHGADVYSYDEDDMVEDPKLVEHLRHFGINMVDMEKTDKTMLELELDLNQKYEYAALQEEGAQLQPVYGPGYTGMHNLGSSCYINSSLQTLVMVPDFRRKYFDEREQIFFNCRENPSENFDCQMAKLVAGLLSGDYSKEPPASAALEGDNLKKFTEFSNGIRPVSFRQLIGKGHAEFSSRRQQDSEEYLRWLFEKIERHSKGSGLDPVEAFRFELEERTKCTTSGHVLYKRRSDVILALPIDLDAATNKAAVLEFEQRRTDAEIRKERIEPDQVVRPIIPLQACLEAFTGERLITDFHSDAIGAKTNAIHTVKFATFPDFLLIQMQKYTLNADWTPRKLDVLVDVPDQLDLTALHAHGPQAGETLMVDHSIERPTAPIPQEAAPQVNEAVVHQLKEMGFPEEACRKAAYFTRDRADVESAMNWVMEHMDDQDFAMPLAPNYFGGSPNQAKPEDVEQLMSFGFSEQLARRALKETHNLVNQAAEWLFDNPNPPPEVEPMEFQGGSASSSTAGSGNVKVRDGPPFYRLIGFISHMGSSTACGHYVCHLLKDGKWVIFNDEKVAFSEKPPKGLAYIYLYARADFMPA